MSRVTNQVTMSIWLICFPNLENGQFSVTSIVFVACFSYAFVVWFFFLCWNKSDMKGNVLTGLSINGDSQGLERLYGALSANMWPGMILKSRKLIPGSSSVEKEGIF